MTGFFYPEQSDDVFNKRRKVLTFSKTKINEPYQLVTGTKLKKEKKKKGE